MVQVSWKDGSDNWTTAADWSTGAVPGSDDDVIISREDPQITGGVGEVNTVTVSSKLDIDTGGYLQSNGDVTLTHKGSVSLEGSLNTALDIGGTLTNSGNLEIGNSGLPASVLTKNLDNSGTISLVGSSSIPGEGLLGAGNVTNDGTVSLSYGNVDINGDVVGKSGTWDIGDHSSLFFGGNVDPQIINVTSSLSDLGFNPSGTGTTTVDTQINGFTAFDSIVIDTLSNATATSELTFGNQTGTSLTVHVNGSNTSISTDIACFRQGTLIRTDHGEVPVEALAIGNLVLTASGEARPIKWLGHRAIDCRRHPNPRAAWPIRISAQAFGEGRPARDLYVSPGHSICVDVLGEVLIPASCLVNGATIVQVEVDEVTYWHVELESHDILFAESLPAETYLDVGNHNFFVECGVTDLDAAPDAPFDPHADTCRPLHETGPIVEAVRHQLRMRAQALG